MDSYKTLRPLGKGSYGEVFLVKHLKESRQYVVKKMDIRDVKKKQQDAALQEAKLLAKLHHPNIVSYKDSFQDDAGILHIVMGFCSGGDLYTHLREKVKGQLEEQQIMDWFVQIALALDYLHRRNILHRDLKTQNIFLSKSMLIKVGDLGIARVLEDANDMAMTVIGTPYYMSPELFTNKPYSFKSDIWSCGCVVYEMLTLKRAFGATSYHGLAMKVIQGKTPQMPDTCGKELGSTIRAMLSQRPSRRPSADELLRLPFIKTAIKSYLERYQRKDPKPAKSSSALRQSSASGASKEAPPTGASASAVPAASSGAGVIGRQAAVVPLLLVEARTEPELCVRHADSSQASSTSASNSSTQSPRSACSSSGSRSQSSGSAEDVVLSDNSRNDCSDRLPSRNGSDSDSQHRHLSNVDASPLSSPSDCDSQRGQQPPAAQACDSQRGQQPPATQACAFRQLPPAPVRRQPPASVATHSHGEAAEASVTTEGDADRDTRPLPQVKSRAVAESPSRQSGGFTTNARKLPARRQKKKLVDSSITDSGRAASGKQPSAGNGVRARESVASGDQSDMSAGESSQASPSSPPQREFPDRIPVSDCAAGEEQRTKVRSSSSTRDGRAHSDAPGPQPPPDDGRHKLRAAEPAVNLISNYDALKKAGMQAPPSGTSVQESKRVANSLPRRLPAKNAGMAKSRSFGDVRHDPDASRRSRLLDGPIKCSLPTPDADVDLVRHRSHSDSGTARGPNVGQAPVGEDSHMPRASVEETTPKSNGVLAQPDALSPAESQSRKLSVVNTAALRTRSPSSPRKDNSSSRRSLPSLDTGSRSVLNAIGRRRSSKGNGNPKLPPTGVEKKLATKPSQQAVVLIPQFDDKGPVDCTDGHRRSYLDGKSQDLNSEEGAGIGGNKPSACSVEANVRLSRFRSPLANGSPEDVAKPAPQPSTANRTESPSRAARTEIDELKGYVLERRASAPAISPARLRRNDQSDSRLAKRSNSSPLKYDEVVSSSVNIDGLLVNAEFQGMSQEGNRVPVSEIGDGGRWAIPVKSTLSRLRQAQLDEDDSENSDYEVLQMQTIMGATVDIGSDSPPVQQRALGSKRASLAQQETSEDSEPTSSDDFYHDLDDTAPGQFRHSQKKQKPRKQESSASGQAEQNDFLKLRLAALSRTCTEGLGETGAQAAREIIEVAGDGEDLMLQLYDVLDKEKLEMYAMRLIQWHRLHQALQV